MTRRASPTARLFALALAACPVHVLAADCKIGKIAELPVTMNGLRPMVTAKINGAEAKFIVDSGAFFSLIAPASAAEFKLRTRTAPFGLMLQGVGGSAEASVTTVKEFALADVPIRNIDFVVGGSEPGGGAVGLLGQNVLRIADVEYDLANGAIRLMKPEGCSKTTMIYWSRPGQAYSALEIASATAGSPHTTGTAFLNGAKIKVLFDTGAATSVLTLRAAERAGVTTASAGVVKAGLSRGIGSRAIPSWIAPFDSFRIGDEEIKQSRLRIADLGSLGADMLIGADFFLSHRIYVASSQRKLYFTYNGGPVFNLTATAAATPAPVDDLSGPADESASPSPSATATATATAPPIPEGQPTDAAGFSRRGAAFAARRDFQRAIEDLTRACELAPTEPDYFYERGHAQLGNQQPALAFGDFDRALELEPAHIPALMSRSALRLVLLEEAGSDGESEVIPDLDKVRAAAAQEADVRFELGNLYARAGALASAIAEYDLWLDKHPREARTAGVLASRCRAKAMLGQGLDEALADCNRAVKEHPDVGFFLDSRGLVHLRMGRFDKAIADYDAELRLQPKNAWALYGRGLARLRKGMIAAGQADIAASKAVTPHVATDAAKLGLVP